MYVCVCKAVTDSQIKQAINEGVNSPRQLAKCLGVGGSCGKCNPYLKELLSCNEQPQTLVQNTANPSILAA